MNCCFYLCQQTKSGIICLRPSDKPYIDCKHLLLTESTPSYFLSTDLKFQNRYNSFFFKWIQPARCDNDKLE